MKILRISCVFGGFLSLVLSLSAQTFTTVHSFDFADGAGPNGALLQATNGNFYGTTANQGLGSYEGGGTVFKITPGGTLTTLYNFCNLTLCADGLAPFGGLVQATNGNFYGTTENGGANVFYGTVFQITPSGMLTTLYNFCPPPYNCTDGANPGTALIQGTDGNFYGTTVAGGSGTPPVGTVFKITAGGSLTTLHSFDRTDGEQPYGTLVQAANGDLYGTTSEGGTAGAGTVFKITTSGTLTTLYNFCSQSNCADGEGPYGALAQANGSFYGTTLGGGASTFGTVFKITGSTLITLHSFDGVDGVAPRTGLIQATDGNFYGATAQGGANTYGTVFKITPSGTLTTLHNFDDTDGTNPYGGLIQATSGTLYGTAYGGGADNGGTIFSLSVGLGPFVEPQPASGRVGAAVKILGTNLTGATSVMFNGTSATFRVVSRSEITTTVPTGATTGKIKVTTPARTLTSNVSFQVRP